MNAASRACASLTEANVDALMDATAKKTLLEVEHIVACLAPKPDVSASIRKLPQRAPPTACAPSAPAQPEPPGGLFATAPRSENARPRVEQLSQARHEVQLTVSSETRAKLERARDLMKHRNPSGELEVVLDRAMDALLEKLEKERLAKTSRPQKTVRPSKPGHIPAAVRREVFARDGEQCAQVDAQGVRCGCTSFVELDHRIPRARGGADDASNLRVACRAHHRMAAEQVFGEDYVAARIEEAKAARRGGAAVHPLPRRRSRLLRDAESRPRPNATALQPMTVRQRGSGQEAPPGPNAQAGTTLPSPRDDA